MRPWLRGGCGRDEDRGSVDAGCADFAQELDAVPVRQLEVEDEQIVSLRRETPPRFSEIARDLERPICERSFQLVAHQLDVRLIVLDQ